MDALRQIPPVNDVIHAPELVEFRPLLARPFGAAIVRNVIAEIRQQLSVASGNGSSRAGLTRDIALEVARRLRQALQPSLRRVINASGVILHTNLGRAPLAEGAIDYLREVTTGYSNLEFDLAKGSRGKRDVHAEQLLRDLLGCEAAIVVNNNAAAVLLVLNSLAEGGEVIASRGEQIEIGESFRIPEIMTRSGARLREIGTTNRTRIEDYAGAIGENTRLLMRVHQSNFRMAGFVERPSLQAFAELGLQQRIPTFEDLGSGCLIDVQPAGLEAEPLVAESIRAGIDVVSFSGDKLLGGPQAGVIAGKKPYLDKIRRNPLFRALRVDKLTFAALEYTLRQYLSGEFLAIPACRMLQTSADELKCRAEAFARKAGAVATPLELQSIPGGGAAPESSIASWGVVLQVAGHSAARLEERLRRSNPPVIARVEKDRVILDFRSVLVSEDQELLRVVAEQLLESSL
jgi:L-seryl-tRNA(Ser) seleniumtransferase